MRAFWIGFGIPFVIGLLFPLALYFCVPRSTKPSRWIQNCPPFSIFMLSAFPIAMGVFLRTIVGLQEVNGINLFAASTYGSSAALYAAEAGLLFLCGFGSIIVVHDFISRPVAPYILRGPAAMEAFALEKELRKAAKKIHRRQAAARARGRSQEDAQRGAHKTRHDVEKPPHSRDQAMAKKISNYQQMVQLGNVGAVCRQGNWVAAAYLGIGWLGTMGCVFYFWAVAVLVLTDQTLPAGTVKKLLTVFILLVTWFPMRVHMDWYQNYFHNTAWLRKSNGFLLGICLGMASLVFVIFIAQPEAVAIVCAVLNALVLLFVGVAGRFKPDWLRTVAESLQSLPFVYFFGIYVIFLFVTFAIGIRILKVQ